MLIIATYSLERMHSYINAEQEPKPTKQGIPPAYWPASGDLKVEKLSARYSLVRDKSIPWDVGPALLNVVSLIGWAEGSPRHIFPHQIW